MIIILTCAHCLHLVVFNMGVAQDFIRICYNFICFRSKTFSIKQSIISQNIYVSTAFKTLFYLQSLSLSPPPIPQA